MPLTWVKRTPPSASITWTQTSLNAWTFYSSYIWSQFISVWQKRIAAV